MALDATRLGEKMAAAVIAGAPTDNSPVTNSALEAIWIAIAQEIITEITANGVTTTPVTSGSSAGTYPGTIS